MKRYIVSGINNYYHFHLVELGLSPRAACDAAHTLLPHACPNRPGVNSHPQEWAELS